MLFAYAATDPPVQMLQLTASQSIPLPCLAAPKVKWLMSSSSPHASKLLLVLLHAKVAKLGSDGRASSTLKDTISHGQPTSTICFKWSSVLHKVSLHKQPLTPKLPGILQPCKMAFTNWLVWLFATVPNFSLPEKWSKPSEAFTKAWLKCICSCLFASAGLSSKQTEEASRPRSAPFFTIISPFLWTSNGCNPLPPLLQGCTAHWSQDNTVPGKVRVQELLLDLLPLCKLP